MNLYYNIKKSYPHKKKIFGCGTVFARCSEKEIEGFKNNFET